MSEMTRRMLDVDSDGDSVSGEEVHSEEDGSGEEDYDACITSKPSLCTPPARQTAVRDQPEPAQAVKESACPTS
jgi:hypothetical protein